MPTCRKCNSNFRTRVVIGGKSRVLSSRKFCLTCSPFGNRNNRAQIDPAGKKTCTSCKQTFPKSRNYFYYQDRQKLVFSSACISCKNTKSAENIRERKRLSVAYKGGSCMRCGYSKCMAALEFHHRDQADKAFTVAYDKHTPFEQLKKELDKCDLLCSNCHRETHAN